MSSFCSGALCRSFRTSGVCIPNTNGRQTGRSSPSSSAASSCWRVWSICCCVRSCWCGRCCTRSLATLKSSSVSREVWGPGAGRCTGRLYLRHFNELDHELQGRLGRGYKPAAKYMNAFVSPLLAVLAKNVAFFSGSVLAVLIALTVYDEDVLTVQHILTAITVLGVVITITRYV